MQTIIDHHHQGEKTATKVRFAEPNDDRKEDLFNHDAEEEDDDTDVPNGAAEEKNEVNSCFVSFIILLMYLWLKYKKKTLEAKKKISCVG